MPSGNLKIWLPPKETRDGLIRWASVSVLLYFFLVGVKALSTGLKLFGGDFATPLFHLANNPFAALMTGMLATVLFQSSSVTTSILVGLVGSGTLSIGGAVPMIMGANIGTSVTNTLVSLSFWHDRKNFEKAFSAATVHDFFNILSVAVLLPLEILTGFIEKSSTGLAALLYGTASSQFSFSSPIKAAIKPTVHFIQELVQGAPAAPFYMVVIATGLILFSLTFIVRTMKTLVAQKENSLVERVFSKNVYSTMALGVLITFLAQSSSITTSLLIPLAGSGVLSLRSIYPVTIGANLGTTGTALLAALAGNVSGLAIALVHLIFNVLGTLLFFVYPKMRELPIGCAEALASTINRARFVGVGYVAFVFLILPLSMIYISQ